MERRVCAPARSFVVEALARGADAVRKQQLEPRPTGRHRCPSAAHDGEDDTGADVSNYSEWKCAIIPGYSQPIAHAIRDGRRRSPSCFTPNARVQPHARLPGRADETQ